MVLFDNLTLPLDDRPQTAKQKEDDLQPMAVSSCCAYPEEYGELQHESTPGLHNHQQVEDALLGLRILICYCCACVEVSQLRMGVLCSCSGRQVPLLTGPYHWSLFYFPVHSKQQISIRPVVYLVSLFFSFLSLLPVPIPLNSSQPVT